VVVPGKGPSYARILAAVDPSPEDVDMDDCNVKIMDLATSLTTLNHSDLHIVHVWEFTGNDLDTIRSEIPDEVRKQLLLRVASMHREILQHLLERYSLEAVQHQIHVLRGELGLLLPKIVEQEKIDLLVMGTVGRVGIPGLLIGNTAEFILRQVECALLTVKPEGFVTPVTLEE